MTERDYLSARFPRLAARLPRLPFACLPTPVEERSLRFESVEHSLSVKYDNRTGKLYGGNKVRKLEYLFAHAGNKRCERIATFGTAGSHHALATALYAREAGFDCTCFLFHQPVTADVAATLNKHVECGTEIVRFGGAYSKRLETLRRHLHGRNAWVIPLGGSSWLGNMGFVAAGLELADQVAGGEIPSPDRLYVGSGTMGTAVGLAIGLAIAGLETEVQAVRVSDVTIMNREKLDRLLAKTVYMMRRLDASVPDDIATRVNVHVRDEFFGPGYAKGTALTQEAIAFGRDVLDLTLEQTYTGKALAALLHDWRENTLKRRNALYWHTFNSSPLGVPADKPLDAAALPEEFRRYFET